MLFRRAPIPLFSFPVSSFLTHLGLSRVMTWARISATDYAPHPFSRPQSSLQRTTVRRTGRMCA